MTGKKTSNNMLKEQLDNLSAKVKILEDMLMNLTTKSANDHNEESKDIEKIESNKQKKVIKMNDDKNTQIKCKECEFSCQQTNILKTHMKEDHNVQPLEQKCSICDKTFKENVDLELHLKNEHFGAETFSCNLCDQKFYLEWRLRRHKEVHSTSKFCHYLITRNIVRT